MPTLKNVSPYGDLVVALLGRAIAAGEEFEATAEQVKQLNAPNENYKVVTTKKTGE
jgi:hypothetical protein